MKVLHYISFGIFPGGVTFSNGFSYDELFKEFKRQKLHEYADAIKVEEDFFKTCNYAYAKVVQKKNGKDTNFFFIFTKESFKFTDYEYCKLAHEVLHICQAYLIDILDRNIEREAEAYLHTHIMGECLKILRGAKRNR